MVGLHNYKLFYCCNVWSNCGYSLNRIHTAQNFMACIIISSTGKLYDHVSHIITCKDPECETRCLSVCSWLIVGKDYEARQTSKEQTKMPRFIYDHAQSFDLGSYSMHELHNLVPRVFSLTWGCRPQAREKTLGTRLCQPSTY